MIAIFASVFLGVSCALAFFEYIKDRHNQIKEINRRRVANIYYPGMYPEPPKPAKKPTKSAPFGGTLGFVFFMILMVIIKGLSH